MRISSIKTPFTPKIAVEILIFDKNQQIRSSIHSLSRTFKDSRRTITLLLCLMHKMDILLSLSFTALDPAD